MLPMTAHDPIARELYDFAWTRTIERLPGPPQASVGPASTDEYLAFIQTLAELAAGVEANLLVVMEQAATVYHVPHAAIGQACGTTRQAVRQRLLRARAAAERQRDERPWDEHYGYDDYWDDDE